MKTKKLLLMLAIASFMLSSSCKKDEEANTLPKEEAQVAINSANSDFQTLKSEFDASAGTQIQEAMKDLNLTFDLPMKVPAKSQSIQKDLLNIAKPAFAKVDGGDDPFFYFSFNEYVGTWTLDTTTHIWSHTEIPTDKVVIVFPCKGAIATLTYYDFESKTFEAEDYVSQLKFKAEISGQTAPVFSWVYTSSQTANTQDATIEYSFGKFTQIISYSTNTTIGSSINVTASILLEIKKEGHVIYSNSADISVSGNPAAFTFAITAKIVVLNVEMKVEMKGNQDTDLKGDPNKFMKISVWKTTGEKIADIVLIYDSTQNKYLPFFKFSDGTTVSVKDVLDKNLLEFINEFVDEITNEIPE